MTSSNGNIFRITGHLCGNSPVTGKFPSQRPVTRSFDVFFYLRLNKRMSKQWWGWWFEIPSHPRWRQCNAFLGPNKSEVCSMRSCLNQLSVQNWRIWSAQRTSCKIVLKPWYLIFCIQFIFRMWFTFRVYSRGAYTSRTFNLPSHWRNMFSVADRGWWQLQVNRLAKLWVRFSGSTLDIVIRVHMSRFLYFQRFFHTSYTMSFVTFSRIILTDFIYEYADGDDYKATRGKYY